MRIIVLSKFILAVLIGVLLISACNFPASNPAPTESIPVTEKHTLIASETENSKLITEENPTATLISTWESPTLTSSAPSIIAQTPTFTPVLTFTPAPTRPLTTTGVQGQVTIIKPSRVLPMGGASVTLYDEKTKNDLISTITIMDGSFRFTQVPSGKYYLVVVWVISKSGAWPCSNEKIPAPGNRRNWHYDANGLPIYVEIFNKTTNETVVVLSTGGFGVSGTKKSIDIPLICNQLK